MGDPIMPNMNTYFKLMGIQARQKQYEMIEARRLLILLLFPIDGEFIIEVSKYFWSGYTGKDA
jgi:hypothetical protein